MIIERYSKNVPQKVRERRRKVAVYMGKGFTQREISEILGENRTMICRDMKAIEEVGNTFAYSLAKENGMSHMMLDSLVGMEGVINGLELKKAETYQITNPNTGEITTRPVLGGNAIVAAFRVQMECYEKIFEMAKNGPFVIGAKKIMAEFEKIKANAKTGKEIDIHPILNNGR